MALSERVAIYLYLFSVNRVIRVGFCPPGHLGKIMNLIRSGVRISLGRRDCPFRLKPGQCQRRPQMPAAAAVTQSLCQVAGLLRTLYVSAEPFPGDDRQLGGNERDSRGVLEPQGHSFPAEAIDRGRQAPRPLLGPGQKGRSAGLSRCPGAPWTSVPRCSGLARGEMGTFTVVSSSWSLPGCG